MNLENIREEINSIDSEIIKLFEKRMKLSGDVATYKKENNIPINNYQREREVVNRLSKMVDENLSVYVKSLYENIFTISKAYQSKLIVKSSKIAEEINSAINNTEKILPQNSVVACQGIEGAYSTIACEKLFQNPTIMYFNNFRGVFEAVAQGMCKYGILPMENSIYGTVREVGALMHEYNFNIVMSEKIQINHVLLAKRGTTKINEIFSHEQAIGQCEKYLKSIPNVKITVCENTAEAAKMVAESDRTDVASISSAFCAELYGLSIIEENIKDSDNNYTRFMCISKNMEIYPGADRISFMINLSHKPGALHSLISKFSAIGINLTKIESRPIIGRDFEFSFYFEMDISAYSKEFLSLIADLEENEENFKFLGSYSEK